MLAPARSNVLGIFQVCCSRAQGTLHIRWREAPDPLGWFYGASSSLQLNRYSNFFGSGGPGHCLVLRWRWYCLVTTVVAAMTDRGATSRAKDRLYQDVLSFEASLGIRFGYVGAPKLLHQLRSSFAGIGAGLLSCSLVALALAKAASVRSSAARSTGLTRWSSKPVAVVRFRSSACP